MCFSVVRPWHKSFVTHRKQYLIQSWRKSQWIPNKVLQSAGPDFSQLRINFRSTCWSLSGNYSVHPYSSLNPKADSQGHLDSCGLRQQFVRLTWRWDQPLRIKKIKTIEKLTFNSTWRVIDKITSLTLAIRIPNHVKQLSWLLSRNLTNTDSRKTQTERNKKKRTGRA